MMVDTQIQRNIFLPSYPACENVSWEKMEPKPQWKKEKKVGIEYWLFSRLKMPFCYTLCVGMRQKNSIFKHKKVLLTDQQTRTRKTIFIIIVIIIIFLPSFSFPPFFRMHDLTFQKIVLTSTKLSFDLSFSWEEVLLCSVPSILL